MILMSSPSWIRPERRRQVAGGRIGAARTPVRQVRREAHQCLYIEVIERPIMRSTHVCPPPIDHIVHLPQQIGKVLSRDARNSAGVIALPGLSMAAAATQLVEVLDFSGRRGRRRGRVVTLEVHRGNEGHDVSDVLGSAQDVPLGNGLHMRIPAYAVPVVKELLDQISRMLAGDDGHPACRQSLRIVFMAGGAVGEYLRTPSGVWLQAQYAVDLTLGTRARGGCGSRE